MSTRIVPVAAARKTSKIPLKVACTIRIGGRMNAHAFQNKLFVCQKKLGNPFDNVIDAENIHDAASEFLCQGKAPLGC
jgi:hypothetical protein